MVPVGQESLWGGFLFNISHNDVLRDYARHSSFCLCQPPLEDFHLRHFRVPYLFGNSPRQAHGYEPSANLEGMSSRGKETTELLVGSSSHCRLWRSVWLLSYSVHLSSDASRTKDASLLGKPVPSQHTPKCLEYSAT